jgi:hypothetical protein
MGGPARLHFLGATIVALASTLGGCGADDRPATWVYISAAIVQPSCATARCHARGSAAAGLQLDSIEGGYLLLVGSSPPQNHIPPLPPSTPPAGSHHVVPGRPEASLLMRRLQGEGARRMPPDDPLPEADIALVERWIREGALYDR